jgi:integrase
MKGSTYKRCQCPAQYDDKGRRKNCRKDHGSWFYAIDAGVTAEGKRRLVRRGGYRTQDDAERAMREVATAVDTGRYSDDDGATVGEWLAKWLELKEREGIRPTTLRAYRHHVRDYLVPHLGRIRLRDLRAGHVDHLISVVNDGTRSAATVHRIHATLSSALQTAARKDLVAFNVARKASLPKTERPKVQPWEPAELGQFLDSVGSHRLGAMFELIAGTGLRRGEAIGLRWDDVNLVRRTLTVRQQVVQESGRRKEKAPADCPYCEAGHIGVSFGPVKTAAGENRVVELDDHTVGALMAHKLRQDAERAPWGEAYVDHGLVFAREDGNPLRPDEVTRLFGALADKAGVRRVRLHDLRHGHASLMLAAGVELPVVSKRLGHSSIGITADTYSHMLEGVGREASERAAALIPRASKGPARSQNVPNPGTKNAPAESAGENQQVSEGAGVGPVGLEPTTNGLKVLNESCQAVTPDDD